MDELADKIEAHECFTVSSTAYLRNADPREGCIAVHYQKPPRKTENGTSFGLRFPFLIVANYIEDQQAVADKIARILNEHWDGGTDE